MPKRPKRAPSPVESVRRMALSFPGVQEGTSYGTIAFRVSGKFLARFWEDGETLVVKCGFEERDSRLLADPETFFTTDHYRGYPTVLVRVPKAGAADLREVFEEAWRRHAPKRMLEAYRRPAGE